MNHEQVNWFAFWSAFAASLPALLAAIAAFIQSLRNSAKASQAITKTEEVAKMASQLIDTTEKVAARTEEVKHIALDRHGELIGKIIGLEKTIVDLRDERAQAQRELLQAEVRASLAKPEGEKK